MTSFLSSLARWISGDAARRILAEYGPSVSLVLAGIPIAFDYGRTGRLDLLFGGILVSLMGVALADLVLGTHSLAGGLGRLCPFWAPVHPRLPLALVGLATTLTLLAGELAVFSQRHAVPVTSCLDPCVLADLSSDPSFLKILATAFLFPAASAMNLPSVHARLLLSLSALEIKCLQNVFGLGGAVFIGIFGLFIGSFSALAFGILCGAAHLMSFSVRSGGLEPAL